MFKLQPGINSKCSNEEYHGDREYISSSGLKLMFKDPKEFYNRYVLGDMTNAPKGEALDFGSYIHARILEPEIVDDEFAVMPDTIKTRRGVKWEEFQAQNIDKTIITGLQGRKADKLIEAYSKASVTIDHPEHGEEVAPIPGFFSGGVAEETMCAEIDGVKVKVRFDYRKEWESFGSINDVKTTGKDFNSLKDIEYICCDWQYDISAALYVDVAEIVTGKPHDFFFLFMSTSSSPKIRLVKASEQMIENGRRKYKEAIKRLKEARKTGTYYSSDIEEINTPQFDLFYPEIDMSEEAFNDSMEEMHEILSNSSPDLLDRLKTLEEKCQTIEKSISKIVATSVGLSRD